MLVTLSVTSSVTIWVTISGNSRFIVMQSQSFGSWLKRRRKALDLTQAELASQVGCCAAAIRKIEAEERCPSALIASTIVHALGYVEPKKLPAEEQLMDGIEDKQMLLVLDNCEHLIEAVASLASALLAASRESLRIPGEWLYPLPVLDVPAFEITDETSSFNIEIADAFPALRLFAERARAVRLDFP